MLGFVFPVFMSSGFFRRRYLTDSTLGLTLSLYPLLRGWFFYTCVDILVYIVIGGAKQSTPEVNLLVKDGIIAPMDYVLLL